MNTIKIQSVKQMTIEQIKTLIDQLEFAITTEMTLESKHKLNHLIGQCIDIYIAKK